MKIITLLFLFALPASILSQKAPIKWKEIPMEDLQMTNYDLEPNAPAVVLCDYGKIYFDVNPNGRNLFVFYDRHIRIKILNTEGLKYARFSVPFHYMPCERLEGENSIVIKAMVYNLSDKGEIVATKVKNKEIKYKDSTNCIRIAELDFPDVKPGSIIEYSYQKPSFDFIQPQSWYFQREIPTRHSELRMRAPRAFRYLYSAPNVQEYDEFEETDYNSSTLQYFQDISGKQMRFVKKNIESFAGKSFMSNPGDYLQKLNIHLKFAKQENMDPRWKRLAYQLLITTHEDYDEYDPAERTMLSYPSGYILYDLKDWENFNQKLLKSQEFGLPLATFWDFKPHLDSMIQNKVSQKDKMLAVYDYLRKNMKWNKKYTIDVNDVHSQFINKMYAKITHKMIKEKSLSEPFLKKEGTSSEINFLLIYFLNKAGIEANPVLISTRDNGKVDQNIPEKKQFNNVLAYATIENEQFLLDATDSLRPYQFLDINDLNSQGFLVRGKDFGWIDIANNRTTGTRITEKISIDNNLDFQCKTMIVENGYEALQQRKAIHQVGKEKFAGNFESEYLASDQIKKFEIDNIKNDTLPLIISFSRSGVADNVKEIRIHPFFYPDIKAEDFTEFVRKYPIDINYPFQKSYTLELTVPDNFIVELPANDEYSTFGGYAGYQYSSVIQNNNIVLKIDLKILTIIFPETEYNNLRELFSGLNEKLNEGIVIKPKQQN